MRTSTCPRCGTEFEQSGRGRPKKFCRKDCGWAYLECANCGSGFRNKPHRKYCSTECRLEAMGKRNSSDPEEQRRRSLLGVEKRIEYHRNRASGNWYRRTGGRHEHRVVAEAVLDRQLQPGEVVHHEDQDRLNNYPDNLIVFPTQAAHALHHAQNHLGDKNCGCDCIRLGELV